MVALKDITDSTKVVNALMKHFLTDQRADGFTHLNLSMMREGAILIHRMIRVAAMNGMKVHEISAQMGLTKEQVQVFMDNPNDLSIIEVGSIVRSKDTRGNPLHCGSSQYGAAVVVSLQPFVMVSEEADMRWSTWKADDVEVIGKANPVLLERCMHRLEK